LTWASYSKKDITWEEFRDCYKKNGGDGIYGAWKLAYEEPFYKKENLNKRQNFINLEKNNNCPNAEYLQPKLFQFKTNYMNLAIAKKQSKILYKTLNFFDKKN
jgi:perosamine synthetase